MLRRHWKLSGVVLVVLAGLTLSLGALAGRQSPEQETEISLEQAPAAVRAALSSQGGTVQEIERVTENGQTFYEADVLLNGRKVEVRLAADGSPIGQAVEDDEEADDEETQEVEDEEEEQETDETLSLEQVPDPVRKTLEAQGGTIQEIEREDEDGQVVYEAEIVIDAKTFDLKIAPDGTLLRQEADEEDDEPQEK